MPPKSGKTSEKIKTSKKAIKVKRTTQNAIHYDMMLKNGICVLPNHEYSSSMKFTDINYQIAPEEEQMSIFQKYTETLNSLGNERDVQLTIHNRTIDTEEFKKDTFLQYRNDEYDTYRKEFNDILLHNITEGTNKIISEKMITYTVQEESYEEAKKALDILNNEFSNRFRELGCAVEIMNGISRLDTIYSMMHPDKKLFFNYDKLDRHFTTKDAVAPDCLDFKSDPHWFSIDSDRCAKVMYLKNYSTELSDKLIQSFAQIERNLVVSFHMRAIPRGNDVDLVKTKIAQMEMQKIDENQKALKRGYDPEMIPMELRLSLNEAEILLQDVQQRNQRLFECQFLVLINEPNEEELKAAQKEIETAVKKLTCELGTLSWRQEEGLNGILPFGTPINGISRTLTTSVCAVVMPFTSQELMQKGRESLYYGTNTLTKNLILLNRKRLQTPSGFVLAKPGAGKSFSCKREITQVYLNTGDDLIIIDPEREYNDLTNAFNGSTIKVDNKSGTHLNSFEGDITQSDFLPSKNEFAQAFMAKINGGSLTPIQSALIERCVRKMYEEYLKKLSDKRRSLKIEMPSLNEFYDILKSQDEKEAKDLAISMEMYVHEGSYNIFSGQSNVDMNNRLTVFDILELPEMMKPLGLMMILESLWDRIITNFRNNKNTWIWIDEIYLLFQDDYSSYFLYQLYKRARKYGAIITGITQNVEDLLANTKARTMLSNSEFILMLNQATSDRDQLADLLAISQEQAAYITSAQKGSGLLFNGKSIIPFNDNFPKNTKLYELFTTDFEEKKKLKQGISLV